MILQALWCLRTGVDDSPFSIAVHFITNVATHRAALQMEMVPKEQDTSAHRQLLAFDVLNWAGNGNDHKHGAHQRVHID